MRNSFIVKKSKFDRKLSNKISMYIVMVIFLMLSLLLGLILDTLLGTIVLFTIIFGLFSLFQVIFGLSVVGKIIVRLMSLRNNNKTQDIEIETAGHILSEIKESLNLKSDVDLMLIESSCINALSVGRGEHTHTVCITKGALEKLEIDELKALLLHELYHITQKDTDYLTTVSGTFGSPMLIYKLSREKLLKLKRNWNDNKISTKEFINSLLLHSLIIGFSILFIPLSFLSNVFVSVRKEFDADLFASELAGKDAVLSLLSKAKENCQKFDTEFSFIRYHFFVHPHCADAKGKVNFISGTYPSIDERIKKLQDI